MAYVRRNWVDYPDTTTPIDADALNNIEDGIEESHNIQLLAVTDTAPSECAEGDKYFDTTTGLIYTATGTDTWGETGETPIYDILYIVLDEQTSYTYNGTTLVSVGGGSSAGGGETLKIGTILPFSGSTLPTGYLFCDGSAISRTTYAGLFAVIGTAFGAGDGSTTFNLPNLNGRVPVGQDSNDTDFDTLGETGGEKEHTLTVDEMPEHKHEGIEWLGNSQYNISLNSGSLSTGYKMTWTGSSDTSKIQTVSAGGGQAHNNVQPYVVVNYIIKATQTTPVQAQIINEYSTSTTDGYSANYVNGLNTYSTTETVVGRWIDDKPIYRKVISFTTPSEDVDYIINTGASIDTTIKLYGGIKESSGGITPIPTAIDFSGTIYTTSFRVANSSIYYRGNSVYGSKPAYAIIEYTKTTD